MTITEGITHILREEPRKLVLSRPVNKNEACRKIVLTRIRSGYQAEKYTGKLIERELLPLSATEPAAWLTGILANAYRQLDAWTDKHQYLLMVSQKGKASLVTHKQTETPADKPHNREKHHILPEGVTVPPLVDMGIFTAEGKVAAPMRDKYRQINRFLEMLADVLPDGGLTVTDYGCGKSYLTFVVYHYLTVVRGVESVRMTGLDRKADVIAHCNAAAQKYGYTGLRFIQGDIAAPEISDYDSADVVISLHACDTATDHALHRAVRGGAKVILAAPCCQHELNAQLADNEAFAREGLSLLTRYGVVRERAAALMTDAIRANLLGACGYRTQLMEFVDLSHTPKNLLIRAVKTDMPSSVRANYRAEVDALCGLFGFKPALLRLLDGDRGGLPDGSR